jgi:hypothetical protein
VGVLPAVGVVATALSIGVAAGQSRPRPSPRNFVRLRIPLGYRQIGGLWSLLLSPPQDGLAVRPLLLEAG